MTKEIWAVAIKGTKTKWYVAPHYGLFLSADSARWEAKEFQKRNRRWKAKAVRYVLA